MSKSACKARNNFLQRKYAFNSIVGNCTACTGTNSLIKFILTNGNELAS